MSDEMERRLREAGNRLPAPNETDTRAARTRVVASAPPSEQARPRGMNGRRRPLAAAIVAAVVAGSAFGVGYAVAAGGHTTTTKTVRERQGLDAGPGFLPATSWDSVSTGTAGPALAAIAANVPLAAVDRQLLGPPAETARRLGRNGVLFYARFGPTSTTAPLPQRLLPLQLDGAEAVSGFDGVAHTGSTRRLRARVASYDVDVVIFFGDAHPSSAVLAAARDELGRLVVPACPAALQLGAADVAAAKAYVLSWLPAHYPGKASEVAGATATAAGGAAAPRHGEAAHDCGRTVAERSVEVDVVLPKLAQVSASLSQLTYFVARTEQGWVVWERAR
jgi:hypothetical protein